MTPDDQAARERFARETARNFSVIASAGVGKTSAIVERIVHIASDDARRAPAAPALLPNLVVVTYTRKAADEMRDRARRALVAQPGLDASVMRSFNRAFFGTIHSFCLELLRRFGPLAGLPTRFTLETDDTASWLACQRDLPDAAAFLPESARAAWRRYGDSEAIWQLARTCAAAVAPPPPGPVPALDLAPLFAFQPRRKHRSADAKLRRSLDRLRRWQQDDAGRMAGVPAIEGGHAEFVELWNETFLPLRAWLAAAAAHAAAQLAADFAQRQTAAGRLGYDDFMRLAGDLLREPMAAERIRAANFSVLLDEAQDTDPAQFAVLVGVAQPAGAPGLWTEGAGAPPAPGRFSMVGDPQQAIYDRADVAAYQELDRRLVAAAAAESLTFSVTMRCDRAIVAAVNDVFPALLDGRNGQARLVELRARPAAGTGAVLRLPVAAADFAGGSKGETIRAEAAAVARWLAAAGPAGLGAGDWSQVALLAPRKNWLELLASALRAEKLSAQVHTGERSPLDRRAADPARAWLTALLTVLADPDDVFETAGVLREIFGISDDALYRARPRVRGAAPLSLLAAPAAGLPDEVAAALALLHRTHRAVAALPLRDAVAHAVAAVQLRERLATLPGGDPAALDALLNQAALADSAGAPGGDALAAFARALRDGPGETLEPAARPGEIQLLTCHKAKGLEWPVVILFGLFCEPRFATPRYPCWLPPSPPGAPPVCAYDKFHAALLGRQAAETAARRAAFARLLYVAATRPRRTLIAVDAESLAADEASLAAVLGLLPGGAARAWWRALPEISHAKIPDNDGISETPFADGAAPAFPAGWPPRAIPPPGFLAAARARAAALVRRVRPSALARHGDDAGHDRLEPDLFAPPDYPEELPPPAAAVAYGNWWHALMESTPWPAGPAAWAAHWEKNSSAAPDPARARAETARLLASPLAARLAVPNLEFAVELPLLWPDPSAARAYDGCLDLAAWDSAAGRWLVVDWKTDHAEGDAAAVLRDRYAPQISIYARALAAVYHAPVDAFLYGTRAGVLAAISPEK